MDGGEEVARSFVTARRGATALGEYPGERPTTLAAAYRIQDRAISLVGDRIMGWKVGRIPPPYDARLGVNRLAGPIFATQVMLEQAGDEPARMPVIAGGFGAVEGEYLLRIGRAPEPGRRGLSAEEAAELVDAVHVGLEIASSPYPRINADGPLVTISDFGNHNGLLVGSPVPDWQSLEFLDWPVIVKVDGVEVGRASARNMLDGPFGAVAFLVDCLADRGLTLQPGQWISSGAVTGVHEVPIGARVVAEFKDLRVSCTVDAARPEETMLAEADHGDRAG